ncbi:GNAT family N-acetyltransferase [Vibrio sp. DW001]|uniref:GNAT family N-acetyltransferase n=1 Tax=Vibrio sp. DW001 TaxID=2912315 RepID=UPI0023B1C0AD|nr:GNAT family N-acetyltransferase [Vibrio sp. DW001]WED25179.1 GNAT family N-acetyltransferase [Vibrio sp. DW001]
MTNIKIRPACLDDLGQLNSLMFDLHDYHHQSMPTDIKTPEEIEKQKSIARYMHDPECLVYVAIDPIQDNVVGFITGHFCELISVVSQPTQMGSVDEVFVSPEYRNQSVANQLMQRLEKTFEEYGVKKIFVEVWQFNQHALKFYEKSGFNHHIHWLCKSIE